MGHARVRSTATTVRGHDPWPASDPPLGAQSHGRLTEYRYRQKDSFVSASMNGSQSLRQVDSIWSDSQVRRFIGMEASFLLGGIVVLASLGSAIIVRQIRNPQARTACASSGAGAQQGTAADVKSDGDS